jgi:PAS domain S-box-containing protein
MRLMFESIAEGIAVTDLDGNITQVNEAAVRMSGHDNEAELIGRSAFELIAEQYHTIAMENLKKTLETGHSGTLEYALMRRDRSEYPG